MATIRKNSWKRIESILRSAVLIYEVRIDDMRNGDSNDRVTPERVLECGRKYEFDRVHDHDGRSSFSIHGNWFFIAHDSIESAKRHLTPYAIAKYFPEAA